MLRQPSGDEWLKDDTSDPTGRDAQNILCNHRLLRGARSKFDRQICCLRCGFIFGVPKQIKFKCLGEGLGRKAVPCKQDPTAVYCCCCWVCLAASMWCAVYLHGLWRSLLIFLWVERLFVWLEIKLSETRKVLLIAWILLFFFARARVCSWSSMKNSVEK